MRAGNGKRQEAPEALWVEFKVPKWKFGVPSGSVFGFRFDKSFANGVVTLAMRAELGIAPNPPAALVLAELAVASALGTSSWADLNSSGTSCRPPSQPVGGVTCGDSPRNSLTDPGNSNT